MKERPILFTGPMVRAILAGRKSQTRRVVKAGAVAFWNHSGYELFEESAGVWKFRAKGKEFAAMGSPVVRCDFRAGDRLWVKETFCLDEGRRICFAADEWTECPAWDGKWKPSIFMPRAASRITLAIERVRAERLRGISPEDARLEGCGTNEVPWRAGPAWSSDPWVATYGRLWDAINGAGAWAGNPWVWVVEFVKLERNEKHE